MAENTAALVPDQHAQRRSYGPTGRIARFVGIAVAVVASSALILVGIVFYQFATDVTITSIDEPGVKAPVLSDLKGGVNLLLVGRDTRAGQGGAYGVTAGDLNDVTMLLHVSEDRTNAVVVSFPRDLIVPIPSCTNAKGDKTSAMSGQQINVAYSTGGLACVNNTVEALTGLEIPYAAAVTFTGVVEMSNAVGGVPVCISKDITSSEAVIHLTAGMHTLQGVDAIQFLRNRHGIGDNSDLARISTQQLFLASLVRTVKSDDTLSNPVKLYSVATAAFRNLEMSSSLANVDTMAQMAKMLTTIDLDRLALLQYPGTINTPQYPGKVVPNKQDGAALFALIKADTPVAPAVGNLGAGSTAGTPSDGTGETADPSAAPVTTLPPTITGQLASDQTCTK